MSEAQYKLKYKRAVTTHEVQDDKLSVTRFVLIWKSCKILELSTSMSTSLLVEK